MTKTMFQYGVLSPLRYQVMLVVATRRTPYSPLATHCVMKTMSLSPHKGAAVGRSDHSAQAALRQRDRSGSYFCADY